MMIKVTVALENKMTNQTIRTETESISFQRLPFKCIRKNLIRPVYFHVIERLVVIQMAMSIKSHSTLFAFSCNQILQFYCISLNF